MGDVLRDIANAAGTLDVARENAGGGAPAPLAPASPSAWGRSGERHVALLIGTTGGYARGLLRGIARFNRERGGWLTYHWPHGLHQALPAWLKRWKGDGIMARVGTRRLVKMLARLGVPIVNLRGAIPDVALPRVGLDNPAIASLAARHLLEVGLTKFATFSTPKGVHLGHDERQAAFCRIIEGAGRECFKYPAGPAKGQGSWDQEQRRVVRWVQSLPKPVGILAINDERGVELLSACRRGGVTVPDDVAVIGVDNDEALCELSIPPLTSIDVNAEQVGYEAAGLLDRMMAGQAAPAEALYVRPRGVVPRRSTETIVSDDPEVDRAVAFIRENAFGKLKVSDVLRHVSFSRASFEPRFKRVTGRTVHEEVQRVRMNRAKMLLGSSKLPIKQVARESGFSGVQYLTRVFRRETGETPAQYRRQRA